MYHQNKIRDPRFRIAHREAWIGVGLALFNFIWWYSFAYGLGSKPISEYHYIFGLPAWFFYSCVVGFIVVTLLVIVCVKFTFKDFPLDDGEEERDDLS
ncbi:putative membrane protein YhdT [Pullulanibacillus pueri]|uniref:Sodium:pantothenate symporter n=1 Tax=Pullulanibacillus pueri TaxID=1437324 RepID=A0A8J3EN94_9BACL|nr:YhdT family protein [Pullulanibacillus pueri]MBM7680665.1 putative membrane protein YhdT [Pullulanibacillus pueri]GGH83800.1 sodium:pantothenate symporter [Pullulanibacillus pueri]